MIAALRFQPTKRPQLAQKAKPKSSFPKTAPSDKASSPASAPQAQPATKLAAKSTLADWTAVGDDDDVNGFYSGEKRQRGGRKRRKNKHREEQVVVQDWDDVYDPTRPNSYDEYKHSEEKIREIREWKDRLYAHKMQKSESEKDSDEEDYRPQMSSTNPSDHFLLFHAHNYRSICSSVELLLRPSTHQFSTTKTSG